MKTPFWLMSAALLFWGWETGNWSWSIVLAAGLSASCVIRARWELSDTDLNRICDLCWVLLLAAGFMFFSTEDRLVFIFRFIQWLPLVFFPIMVAQAYGTREEMPLTVFSWLLRRSPQNPLARKSFNVSFPYFAVCLTGASASTRPHAFFYAGMSLLILVALMVVRPRRFSWPAWVALALLTSGLGLASQRELRQVQNLMETALSGWLANFFRPLADAHECRTLIGSPRPIHLSGRIVLRLRVPPGEIPPGLLREAVFDAYKKETWWASSNDVGSLCPANTNDVVKLMPPKGIASQVQIARSYDNGEGPLALPQGTYQLDNLPAVVRTNHLGIAIMESGPGLADFYAHFASGVSMEAPPGPQDCAVGAESNVMRSVAGRLHLDALKNERQKIRAVESFFRTNFTYSLDSASRAQRRRSETWLGWFLEESRSGHCEYFASATVLLLRQAGVPARYITGYAVPETARHGDTYLIRERHAHAWALVYNGDRWEQIDTTPAGWENTDESSSGWWQTTADLFSDIYFQFSKWRWGKTSLARWIEWVLLPLILYFLWRILTTQRRQRPPDAPDPWQRPQAWPGLDSELYLINRRLASAHLGRLPNEPLHHWEERLRQAFPTSAALRRIFQLHQRLRFDPKGLGASDRTLLRHEATAWLADYEQNAEPPPSF